MSIAIKDMIQTGAHYGHRTNKWNPKMREFIFGVKNGIHILDLQQTVELFDDATNFAQHIVSKGGKILFVGTKRQAQHTIITEAQRSGMPYVANRWLGGMLTNFKTIKESIKKLKRYERMIETNKINHLSKKEIIKMNKEIVKLERNLGGLRDLKKMPKALFVIDIKKEHLAIADAKRLGIKVIALADSNVDPTLIDYIIPANDDGIKSIKLFTQAFADACVTGSKLFEENLQQEGSDVRVEKKKFQKKGKKRTVKRHFTPNKPKTEAKTEVKAEVKKEVKTETK